MNFDLGDVGKSIAAAVAVERSGDIVVAVHVNVQRVLRRVEECRTHLEEGARELFAHMHRSHVPLQTVLVANPYSTNVAGEVDWIVSVRLGDVVDEIASATEWSGANLAKIREPELVVLDAALCRQHRAALSIANLANQLIGMVRLHVFLFLEDLIEDSLTEHAAVVFDPRFSSVGL